MGIAVGYCPGNALAMPWQCPGDAVAPPWHNRIQCLNRPDGVLVCKPGGTFEAAGPTQYFKIGHYRAPVEGITTLYFDDFRRGDSRDALGDR
jgi:hypothetical protein